MDSGLQADPLLLQLPDECLLAVLRCFADDIRSLFSAARAHSRLHQAAVLAAGSIKAMVLEQDQARSILIHLGNHGQHVDSIDLKGEERTVSLRQLPQQKLQKLSSLKVSRCRLQLQPGYGFQGMLWAGAPLQQLRLEHCKLFDNIAQLAAALSLLPGLQHLCFSWNTYSNDRMSFPSSVLQKLQWLTCLDLAGNQVQDTDGLQHLQGLTRLQDLQLNRVEAGTIHASWLSGLQNLTQLKLDSGFQVEPGTLAGKAQLQHLQMHVQWLFGSPTWAEQLLSHMQHLQQLTYIEQDPV